MGADLMLAMIPCCTKTDERKDLLLKCCMKLKNRDLDECCDLYDEVPIEIVREDLTGIADEYWNLTKYRDVVVLQPTGCRVPYICSGGMSWGDSPTDSFDVIEKMLVVAKIFRLLYKWAKQDQKEVTT